MSRQIFNTKKNGRRRLMKSWFSGPLNLAPGNANKLPGPLDKNLSVNKLRQALNLWPPEKIAVRKPGCHDVQALSRLGIRMEQDIRLHEDSLGPDYPLLASCYTRFGHIRLSGKRRKTLGMGGKG